MEKKISVIIPNFNGKGLLKKHLPTVVKNCSGCEIIIVDDGSSDDSVKFLKQNFPKMKVISLSKNQGFARAVNKGVGESIGDLVLFLNTDVAPRANFLKLALKNFKDKNLFAVALADLSHENGKIITRGRGGATFRKGFVEHFAQEPQKAETLWVSGGSGLFDKQKFLELGGFDPIFTPFYWEDIDLSFRARKKGYICIFEPDAKVDHYHSEGAIQSSKSAFFIKTVSYKNQFLFVWKNISDAKWLIEHLLWIPYHLAKALIIFDFAFFAGFLWALIKIPVLILNYSPITIHNSLSDREVFAKFAKQ